MLWDTVKEILNMEIYSYKKRNLKIRELFNNNDVFRSLEISRNKETEMTGAQI